MCEIERGRDGEREKELSPLQPTNIATLFRRYESATAEHKLNLCPERTKFGSHFIVKQKFVSVLAGRFVKRCYLKME